MILSEHGLSKDECIFVTDTLGDIKEADDAGIRTIAVLWGYHSVEMLNLGEPHIIIHDPDELISAIEDVSLDIVRLP